MTLEEQYGILARAKYVPSDSLSLLPRDGGVPVNGSKGNILFQRALVRLTFLIASVGVVQAMSMADGARSK